MNTELWEEFFEEYYHDEVINICNALKINQVLRVKYDDIVNFLTLKLESRRRWDILYHPGRTLEELRSGLQKRMKIYHFPNPDHPIKLEPQVRIIGLPDRIKIRRRDLREEHPGKLVVMDGIVIRTTFVTKRITVARFECKRCGHINAVTQMFHSWTEPYECESDACGRKNCFRYLPEVSEGVSTMMIRLQELPETLEGGEKSQTIDVILENDLAGILSPGNKVSVTGIVCEEQETKGGTKTPFMKMYLVANNVTLLESNDNIVLTPDDKKRMYELASDPGIVDNLVASFAPSIYGMMEIKEAILCSMVSHGFRTRDDGTKERDFIHTLVCTDPAMGKSELKHAAKKIMPDIVLSSGTGSSVVGLTAGVVKDDFANGAFSVEFGALPLADGSGLIIDEADKIKNEDKKKLNDSLSDCKFEIHKGGFHLELWTRCFVVAFENPKFGRFDTSEDILKQIDIPPDTLSRFDFIFFEFDIPDENKDRRIAEQMAKARMGKKVGADGIIPTEDLQKYIALARSVQPAYHEEIYQEVVQQHVRARQKSADGRVSVHNRYAEALFRIAKAQAQLCLSDQVTKAHFQRAVDLLDKSIMHVGRDEHGNLDADIRETGQSKAQRDKVKALLLFIQGLSKDANNGPNGPVSFGEIILNLGRLKGLGITEENVEQHLERLKADGLLIEPREKQYRVV